jgi:hypothetical protein
MSSLRRPPPRPVVAGAFLVSFLAVPLAGRMLRPAPEPPRTPAELAALLRQHRPALYVLTANTAGPQNGIYVCDRPRPREEVVGLLRRRDRAGRWGGVVYCERIGPEREMPEGELADWGEHAMRAGPLLFFGDPRLLAKIAPLVGGDGTGR